MFLHNQVAEVLFYLIFQYQCGRYFTAPVQLGQTSDVLMFISGFIRCRVICITKFADRQHGMLGPVSTHKLLHCIRQPFFVFKLFHIYEIDNNNSANIS